MSVLRATGAVRAALGDNVQPLLAGVGLPEVAQCCDCLAMIVFAEARPGSVCLSVVVIEHSGGGSIGLTAFSHRGCGPCRVFTPDDFEALNDGERAAGPGSGRSAALRDMVRRPTPREDLPIIVEGQVLGGKFPVTYDDEELR